MPVNKSAFKRYLVIIRELRAASYDHPLTRFALADKVNSFLENDTSAAMIEKDIHTLRHDSDLAFFVPIRARKLGYWIEDEYLLSEHIAKTWRI
jgi:hypothetical protein